MSTTHTHDEIALRHWLWLNHGCQAPILSYDDHERRCADGTHTPIDFNHHSLRYILQALMDDKLHTIAKYESTIAQLQTALVEAQIRARDAMIRSKDYIPMNAGQTK